MDHQEAMGLTAERYLLEDLSPEQREEFEAHYFECPICAQDLRLTAQFLNLARDELGRAPLAVPAPQTPKPSWFEFLWRPAVLTPAFGLLLALVAYQNVVVFPRAGGQLSQLLQPHVVATVSLIGGNSRDGSLPGATAAMSQPVLLSLDIPAAAQFASYACVLLDASGAAVWRVPVSQEQARDTVSIGVPAGTLRPGDYTLLVQGLPPQPANGSAAGAADLARYRFALTSVR
jgi:Putative zinc-finger